MNTTYAKNIRRRHVLQTTNAVILSVICLTIEIRAQAILAEDAPHIHNMLVVGENTVFLSHLPMFDVISTKRPTYTSRHRFQVILEATLTDENKSVQDVYSADRKGNPSKIYTLGPEEFILTRLVAPGPQPPPLGSFKGTVFRGHLEEQGRKEIPGLQKIDVNIKRVVCFREFDANLKTEEKPSQLEYVLFGKGDELFLAHLISAPPDFDQILSVSVLDHSFTDEELARGVRIVIPNSTNRASLRIKKEQEVVGEIPIAEGGAAQSLKLRAGVELYFEEGDLQVPPKDQKTDEELKAGF